MDRGNNLQSIMISLLDHHYEIRLAQYKAIADTSNKMRFSRFDTISQLSTAMIPNCIIQPGIFVGTYSAHGWEFIDVQYDGSDANNRILRGTKITVNKVFLLKFKYKSIFKCCSKNMDGIYLIGF